jgi:8-oxo-dGTP diphosphatase
MKPIYAVGAVVYRMAPDRTIEILILRKQGGLWTLPKGKVKRGESDGAALQREVEEETGIVGIVDELIGEARYTVKKVPPRPKIVTYYLMHATAGTLYPDQREQIEEVCWVPITRALLRVRRRRLQTIIRAAQTLLSPAVIRQ